MPGQRNKIPKELAEILGREMTKKLDKQFTDSLQNKILIGTDEDKSEIWKPEKYEYEKLRKDHERKFRDNMMQDWNEIRKQDPDEQFRRQTKADIAEIKDAVRKVGIMFGEDAPSKEMMKKHKMLKDAYNKYKMIEALVLEGE